MKCSGCKTDIPREMLAEMVGDVIEQQGDMESLVIDVCPSCPEADRLAWFRRRPDENTVRRIARADDDDD